jgi:hypothetical protein
MRDAQLAKQKPAIKKNVLTAIRAALEKGMVPVNIPAKIMLQQNFIMHSLYSIHLSLQPVEEMTASQRVLSNLWSDIFTSNSLMLRTLRMLRFFSNHIKIKLRFRCIAHTLVVN